MGKVKMDRGRVRLHNYRTKYSQDAIDKAIQAVKSGMSVKVAAARYQVPRTTLGDRAKGRTKAMLGRPTQLTVEEETFLPRGQSCWGPGASLSTSETSGSL